MSESGAAGTATVAARDGDSLLGLAIEAYLFGYPSVEMFRTMHQLAASRAAGADGYAFNAFVHERRRATAADEWLSAPNSEMLYSNAWLDLSSGPVLLHVPDMGERFYVLQLLDFFATAFAHVGTRTSGNRAKTVAVVGPGWSGRLPDDVAVVRSPTDFGWIFGRISIAGDHELATVNGLQDRLALTPAAARGEALRGETGWPRYRSGGKLDFFANLDRVLRRNPPQPEEAELIARLPRLGILADEPFEPAALDVELSTTLERAIERADALIAERESKFEQFCPGWIWEGPSAGRFGRDHLSRAASAKAGLGILAPEEAIYPFAYVDDAGEALAGSRRYRLAFAPHQLPQGAYSWSVTVYSLPDYHLVGNPIDRYSLGSAAELTTGPDGVVQLALQADRPADAALNWLPTPGGGNFVVALRVFGPGESLLRGEHQLPPVTRVAGR